MIVIHSIVISIVCINSAIKQAWFCIIISFNHLIKLSADLFIKLLFTIMRAKGGGQMSELPKYITDEQTGLKYELVGDYYYIAGDDEPEDEIKIGIYDQMHYQYLKEAKPSVVSVMRMKGTLRSYLADVNKQAEDMIYDLVNQMAKNEGITETLKRQNPMAYVGAMNNIADRARETVMNELICI